MLENIWRGIEINLSFLLHHSVEAMVVLMLTLLVFLFRLLYKLKIQQKLAYVEILEQQSRVEHVQYRLERLNELCQKNRDKQRFISNQLSRMDDSIFELEDRLVNLNENLKTHHGIDISEAFEKNNKI